MALGLYERDLDELQRHLSVASGDRSSAPLAASLEEDAAAMPDVARSADGQFAAEPYRRKLAFMRTRLRAARRLHRERMAQVRSADWEADPEEDALEHAHRLWGRSIEAPLPGDHRVAYRTAAALGADLTLMADSLRGEGASRLADGQLRDVRRRVEVFGFHLARLDLRQHSQVHEGVVAEILRAAGVAEDYLALDEDGRVAVLVRELTSPRAGASPHGVLPRDGGGAGRVRTVRAAARG